MAKRRVKKQLTFKKKFKLWVFHLWYRLFQKSAVRHRKWFYPETKQLRPFVYNPYETDKFLCIKPTACLTKFDVEMMSSDVYRLRFVDPAFRAHVDSLYIPRPLDLFRRGTARK